MNEDILWEGIFEVFNILDEDVGRIFILWKRIFIILDILDIYRRCLE